MPDWMIPYTGHLTVGMALLGFSVVFWLYDRRTPASRALTFVFTCIGLGMLLDASQHSGYGDSTSTSLLYFATLLETFGFFFGIQWVVEVRRGARSPDARRGIGHWLLRFGQLLVLSGGIAELAFGPFDDVRWDYLFSDSGQFFTVGFWSQALPVLIGLLVVGFVILMMAFTDIDRAERSRIWSLMVATPFLASPVLLPPHMTYWTPMAVMLGLLIFGGGSVRYVLIQGRRGQMMSRFLSPEVASAVRNQGLGGLLRSKTVEITSLSVDIRGFTAYAQDTDSQTVMQTLRSFYRIAGQAAREFGGTVKDHAGDGVLILFGAPLELEDHANRALRCGERILCEMRALFLECEQEQLGIGAGAASGPASVGVIEGGARIEYAAVGTVVNLSARLCGMARNGQLLISDSCYARLTEHDREGIEKGKRIRVKGLDDAITVWQIRISDKPRANFRSSRQKRRLWRRRRRAAREAKSRR